ncbi:unnamed protein product [Phytomonas sp. EM1]|nr:unnamed protein product [Phytomonas sp. EM1]|eukprot:CCW59845.1 unnamed protein product [Phytomonas sp. isolate EM1]
MQNSRRRTFCIHKTVEEGKLPNMTTSIAFPTIRNLQRNIFTKPTSACAHTPSGTESTVSSRPISSKSISEDVTKVTTTSDKLPILSKIKNLKALSARRATITTLEASQRDAIESEEKRLWGELLESLVNAVDLNTNGANLKSFWASDYGQIQSMLDSHEYSRAYLGLSNMMRVNKMMGSRFVVLSAIRAFCSYQLYNYAECADESHKCWRLLTCAFPGPKVVLNHEDKPVALKWLNSRFVILWARSLLLCEGYDEAEVLYNLIFSQDKCDQTASLSNTFHLAEDDLLLLKKECDCVPQIRIFREYVNNREWSSALATMKSKDLLDFIEATSLTFLQAVVLFENGQLDAAREVLLGYLAHMPYHDPPSATSSGSAEYQCDEEKYQQHYIARAYLNANLFLSKVGLYCGREYMNIAAVLIQRCLAVDPFCTPAISFGCHLVALEDSISKAESDMEAGRLQNAVKHLTNALAMDSKNNRINAFLFVMRAEAYLQLCRPLQAIEDCTKSIELDAAHAKAFFVRAKAYQRTQKTVEAAADRCMAARLNPSYLNFSETTEPNLGGSKKNSTDQGFGWSHQNFSENRPDLPKDTLYDILGVHPCATFEDIRQAFKRHTLQCHPDKVVNESEDVQRIAVDRFKELNRAHSVLRDPERRSAYDSTLRNM